MIYPKKVMVKQLIRLSLTPPTTEMQITVTQTMEITNRLKLKDPRVNRTSLQQRTSQTTQHQLLMDSKSL